LNRLAILSLLWLCILSPAQAETAAPLVEGDVVITQQMFLDEVDVMPAKPRQDLLADPQEAADLVDMMYRRAKLFEEAERRGLESDPEVQRQLARAKENIMIGKLIENQRAQIQPPDMEALAHEHYLANPERYAIPESVRARHILIAIQDGDRAGARERAEALLQRIRAGEDFAEIADENSDDRATAQGGGELGWFGRGHMTKPFEDAVFALQGSGDLSGVVETEFGFHIIQLEERRESDRVPFDAVKRQIVSQLQKQYVDDKIKLWRASITDHEAATSNPEAIRAAHEKARGRYAVGQGMSNP